MRHRIIGHPVANMTQKIAENDDIGVICGVADDIFWCLNLLNPDVTMRLDVIILSYTCELLSFCSHSRCKYGIRCMYIVKWRNFCLVSGTEIEYHSKLRNYDAVLPNSITTRRNICKY